MSNWISVKDSLPEDDNNVLCWYEYRAMKGKREGKMVQTYGIGYYFKEAKLWGGEVNYGCDTRVVAWMPLPAPPEVEK